MELKLIYFVIFECFLIFQSSNSFEFPALQYQLIKSCKANQSFDGSTLQCFNCPQNAVPTSDGIKNPLKTIELKLVKYKFCMLC